MNDAIKIAVYLFIKRAENNMHFKQTLNSFEIEIVQQIFFFFLHQMCVSEQAER